MIGRKNPWVLKVYEISFPSHDIMVALSHGFVLWFVFCNKLVYELPYQILHHLRVNHDIFLHYYNHLREIRIQQNMVQCNEISLGIWVSRNELYFLLVFLRKFLLWFRHNSWEHLQRCCIAISKGRPIPKMDPKAKEFNHKVAFMEAITEATLQLCLSCLVLREYGISSVPHTKILQLTSLISSTVSICYAFVMVS